MPSSRFAFACLLSAACTNGDGARPTTDAPVAPPSPSPRTAKVPTPRPPTWGWATRIERAADRVLGLAVANDGSTVVLTTQGIGFRADGVALSRYDVEGTLVYALPVPLRAGPEGRALALRDDRVEILDPAMEDDRPAVRIAVHALEDGAFLEHREWDAVGRFGIHELHALPQGDTLVAGYGESIAANELSAGAADGRVRAVFARFGSDGVTKWIEDMTAMDEAYSDTLSAVAVTDDALFVTGSCAGRRFGPAQGGDRTLHCDTPGGDAFLARWSLDGEPEWITALMAAPVGRSKAEAETHALTATADGGVVIVGQFAGHVTLGEGVHAIELRSRGEYDAFLARYDRHGTLRDAWAVGDAGIDRFDDVAIDGDGDAWIAGVVYGQDTLAIDPGAVRPHRRTVSNEALPRFGVLVRVDLDRKAAASLPGRFVEAQGRFFSAGDGVTPERIAIVGDHVRAAGYYGGRIELPILDGTTTSLELRDPLGIDDEVFVWASSVRPPTTRRADP